MKNDGRLVSTAGQGVLLVTRTVVVIAAACLGFVAHLVLPAQTQGPGSTGEAGDNDTFGTTLGQGSLPFEQTLMLSGKVLMDDGAPPGEPVTVYMACGGGREPRGRTSLKGTFTIDLSDRNNLMVGDASVSRPREAGAAANEDPTPFGGRRRQSGRARIRPQQIQLIWAAAWRLSWRVTNRALSSSAILVRGATQTWGRLRYAGARASREPPLASPPYRRPRRLAKPTKKHSRSCARKKPNSANAEKELLKAVAEYPEFAAAWNMLGRIKLTQKDDTGAYEAFEKAVGADASYIAPYSPLLQMAIQDQRWDDATWLCQTILKLNPFASEARYFLAVALFNKGDMASAEQAIRDLQAG